MTTLGRKPLFGRCRNNQTELSVEGEVASKLWQALPNAYPQLEMQALAIMPDHLHGIIFVKERMPQPVGVPIRAFKSQVTSALRKHSGCPELQIWTPSFHDAIKISKKSRGV